MREVRKIVVKAVLGPRTCACGASLAGRAANATRCLNCASGRLQGPRERAEWRWAQGIHRSVGV